MAIKFSLWPLLSEEVFRQYNNTEAWIRQPFASTGTTNFNAESARFREDQGNPVWPYRNSRVLRLARAIPNLNNSLGHD